tara:strand:+ start:265 stop:384 length:120 start_codon:yes stop_codon:yes gene_type:complete
MREDDQSSCGSIAALDFHIVVVEINIAMLLGNVNVFLKN